MSLSLLGEAKPGNDLKTVARGQPGLLRRRCAHPITQALLLGAAAEPAQRVGDRRESPPTPGGATYSF